MPAVKKIERIEEGFIIYTERLLLNAEKALIKKELQSIAAEKIGMLFFRTAA